MHPRARTPGAFGHPLQAFQRVKPGIFPLDRTRANQQDVEAVGLACGCTVLATDTEPVREVIRHGENGLMADFYDVDGLVRQALEVLDDPQQYRPLAEAGVRLVDEKYSLSAIAPRMLELYERVLGGDQGFKGSFPESPPQVESVALGYPANPGPASIARVMVPYRQGRLA